MNVLHLLIGFPKRWLGQTALLFSYLLFAALPLAAGAEERSVEIVFGGVQCYLTTSGLGDDQPYAAMVAADLRSGKVSSAFHAFGDVGEDQLKETKIVVGTFSPLKRVDDIVLLVAFAEHDSGGSTSFDKGGVPGGLMASTAVEKITPIVKKYQTFYSDSIQWRPKIVDELTQAMSRACAETLDKDDLIGVDAMRLHSEDIAGPGTRSVERTVFLKGDGAAYKLYFDIKSNDAFFGANPPDGGSGTPVLPSLSGKWNSNLGTVELVQNGDNLTGTVNFPNQVVGKITGKTSGDTINYKWFVHSGHYGSGKLTISGGGNQLSGDFQSDLDAAFKGFWTLTRVTSQPPGNPGGQPQIPNLVGVWQQLPGKTGLPQATVTIGQEANQPTNFACRIPDMMLFGKGKIAADRTVTVSFGPPNADMSDFGPTGPFAHDSGKITQVDSAGHATRIEWKNGVVYERKSPGGQPQIPSLVGVWQQLPGKTGLPQATVTIGQESNQPTNFACRIPDMMLFGKGKIAADRTVTVSFGPPNADMSDFGPTGPFAHDSGKITQVDSAGRATRIEWKNGVVYQRK